MEFIQNAEPLLKILWYIALSVSAIFIILSIITFAGMDSNDGLNADFDGNLMDSLSPVQLFSFRNLINFLLGFSWAGISFYDIISNKTLLLLISIICGIIFIVIFFYIIKQIQKLAEDNTFKIEKTINKTAQVYISIPEKKTGTGKIQITVNGAFHELDAITENEKIDSGTLVRVVKILNDNLLLVNKL